MANSGEKQYNDYLNKSKRSPTKILKWRRENVYKDMEDFGFQGPAIEEALDHWESLQDSPPGNHNNTAQIGLLTVPLALPLTPQALHTIMLAGFEGCNLRDDRANSPQHLLAANTALFQTIGRQEALKMTFAVMQKRANNSSAHTAYNPLIATHAPPGGGKSTFLDLVLSRSEEVLQQCPPPMAKILKSSVPIAVTYNSKTPFNSSIEADNIPEFSLGCRMLYSYYYTYASDFNYFLARMQHYAQVLTLDGVVQCIRLDAGNKPILLGLDEVVSAFGRDVNIQKVTQIVSKVGLCLNQFGSHFNAVVTTLDTVVVKAETTLSGRPIAFIPLPRLTTEQSVELFQQELASPSTPSYFRGAIVACGGHARTLESLKTFYTATKATCIALDYPRFLLLFCQDLLNVNVLRLTLPLVLCALRNKPVELEFRPTSSACTIRQYIRDGYFINNLVGNEDYVIPIVSPLGLLYFAQQAESTSAIVEQKLAACLTSMIQINPTHWQDYEKFHANWEAVARLIIMGEEKFSFREWYHQPKLCNTTLSFYVGGQEMKSVAIVGMVDDLPARHDLDQEVFLMDFTKNNPGFDIVIFEQKKVVVAIECRFSKPDATTILSSTEVKNKHTLATEAIRQHFGAETKILLVVAAYRKVADIMVLPANTIVLSREELDTLYSPSLSPIFNGFLY